MSPPGPGRSWYWGKKSFDVVRRDLNPRGLTLRKTNQVNRRLCDPRATTSSCPVRTRLVDGKRGDLGIKRNGNGRSVGTLEVIRLQVPRCLRCHGLCLYPWRRAPLNHSSTLWVILCLHLSLFSLLGCRLITVLVVTSLPFSFSLEVYSNFTSHPLKNSPVSSILFLHLLCQIDFFYNTKFFLSTGCN